MELHSLLMCEVDGYFEGVVRIYVLGRRVRGNAALQVRGGLERAALPGRVIECAGMEVNRVHTVLLRLDVDLLEVGGIDGLRLVR